MAHLIALFLVAGLFTCVSGNVAFINPAPFGKLGDFSNSDTYRQGSVVNVAWTPAEEGNSVSVVLWQLNSTTGAWYGDMEYLTQGTVGVVRYSWLVGTRKNLTESNLFYLSLFQEGNGPSDANSHYFYIRKDVTVNSTSAASRPVTSPTTSASSATSFSNKSPISTPILTPITYSTLRPTSGSSLDLQNSPSSTAVDSFPMAAKIGIGVGIPLALILGLTAGFLLFRRRKKNCDGPYEMGAPLIGYQHHHTAYHGSNFNEASGKSQKEMAPVYLHPGSACRHNRASGRRETVRYEM